MDRDAILTELAAISDRALAGETLLKQEGDAEKRIADARMTFAAIAKACAELGAKLIV